MTKSVNVREIALEVIVEVLEKGQYSHLLLNAVLEKYAFLEKTERKFLTRLVEGTLEKQIELDYIINQFSKVKVRKMKPVIRNILRLSVYQLKYMDAVPASAACNEAVKLATKKGFQGLKGFVNGVLRNIGRNLETVTYPDKNKEPVKALSIQYSVPEWMVTMWIEDYGMEVCENILKGFQKETGTSIRVDEEKITKEALRTSLEEQGITVRDNEKIPYALFISGYDKLSVIPEFQKGYFYVQDTSSMLVAEAAAPKEGDYCIDVCAAPGGKSTHLAQMLKGSGMVEARDLTEAKVQLLKDNIQRLKLENMEAVQMDATVLQEASIEKADVLIADLPCSGLGVIGKKKDIKYNASLEKCQDLSELQKRILEKVQAYVKTGGTLIYSTCTICKEENEKNTQWFLENFKEFELVKQQQILPGEWEADGFYIAKFVNIRGRK